MSLWQNSAKAKVLKTVTVGKERGELMKKTDLDSVKMVARALLNTDIHQTELSPIVVQHPFTSSGFNMVMINGEPKCVDITADNEALDEWRKMVSEQIRSAKNAFEIYMMTNKPYGMTFLKYASHHLSKKDFSEILADAWIRSENPNNDPNLTQHELLSMFQSAESKHLMSQAEMNTLDALDATITVYRGITSYNAKNVKALSWTLDRNVAEWFATRFDEDGTVYQAQIAKSHIYAYFNGRNESEVIVDPKYLMDITESESIANCFDITM